MKKRKIIRLSIILIAISTLLLIFSFGIVRIPILFVGEPVWTIWTGGVAGIGYTDDGANAIAVYSLPRGITTHVYVAGYKGEDGWIAKYRDTARRGDGVGIVPTLVWEKDLNTIFPDWAYSKVNDIALTPAGTYLYAVGSYSLTMDYNDRNIFLVILSARTGSVVSSYTHDVSGFADEAYGITIVPCIEYAGIDIPGGVVDASSSYSGAGAYPRGEIECVDIYIIGHALNSFYSSEPPFPDGSIFIAKLRGGITADPEFLWLQTYDGPATDTSALPFTKQDSGNDIIYSDRYVYVTGQVNILGSMGQPITASWVAKVDPTNRELIWVWEQIYGDTWATGKGITIDSAGFLRICGGIGGNPLFLKYSIDGELLSDSTELRGSLAAFGGEARKNVALPRGGVAYTGAISSETGDDYDIFVKTLLWSATVDGVGGDDYGNAITTNARGEIYVAGSIRSLNPSSGVMHDDIWIRKYRTRIRLLRRD